MRRAIYTSVAVLVAVLAGAIQGDTTARSKGNAPFLEVPLELSIDRVARIDEGFGSVTVTGTVSCRRSGNVGLQVHLRQELPSDGVPIVRHADGYARVACGAPGASVPITTVNFSPDGAFQRGKASAFTHATLADVTTGETVVIVETSYFLVQLVLTK